MKYHDLYGTRTLKIDELEQAVASALDISFELRRSDGFGDYYKAVRNGEHYSIRPNYESEGDEEDVLETRFADCPVLLYVDDTERAEELERVLTEIPGLELLRRDTRE
jgi:hypothetical protein